MRSFTDSTSNSFNRMGNAAEKSAEDIAKAAQAAADKMLRAKGEAVVKSLDKRISGLQKQLSSLEDVYEAEDDLLKLFQAFCVF